MPQFTSETGRRARKRKAGLAAARYWRERNFDNLKLAREAWSRIAARRREEKLRQEAEKLHTIVTPTGLGGVWYCTCGLSGYGQAAIVPRHRARFGDELISYNVSPPLSRKM